MSPLLRFTAEKREGMRERGEDKGKGGRQPEKGWTYAMFWTD